MGKRDDRTHPLAIIHMLAIRLGSLLYLGLSFVLEPTQILGRVRRPSRQCCIDGDLPRRCYARGLDVKTHVSKASRGTKR